MRTRSRPRLYVTDRGAGEPVLLITGWTISSAVFDPVAALYLPHVRVVAYDHRGAGRSAPWLGPISMAMLAADAARVLDDRGLRSAHVVGLSMGAAVALELAIRMPHRVKSLVLVGGGAGGPTTATPDVRAAAGTVATLLADTVAPPLPVARRGPLLDRLPRGAPGRGRRLHALLRPPPSATVDGRMADGRGRVLRPPPVAAARSCSDARAARRARRDGSARGRRAARERHPERRAARDARGGPRRAAGAACGIGRPAASDGCARHADREPAAPRRHDAIGERLTRPFSLPAGTLRNTRDATALVARALRRGA